MALGTRLLTSDRAPLFAATYAPGNPQTTRSLKGSPGARASLRTSALPTNSLPQTYNATILWSFTEDFFNYLYVLPSSLTISALAAQPSYSIFVWNAFRVNKTLQTATANNLPGLVFTGPATPLAMAPLGFYEYLLMTPVGGVPVSIGDLTFTTLSPNLTVVVPVEVVSGAVLFAAAPNWRDPVERTYSFLTDVVTVQSGREQRRAVRGTPRVSTQYTYTALSLSLRAFRTFLRQSLGAQLLSPDWLSRAEIASTLGSVATFTTTAPWIAVGKQLFLQNRLTAEMQIFTVTAIDGLDITFGSPIPSSLYAYRSVICRLRDAGVQHFTDSVGESRISLEYEPGFENNIAPGAPVQTLDGREVLTLAPDWSDAVTHQYEKLSSVFDTGYGRRVERSFRRFTAERTQLNFVGLSFNSTTAYEDFFRRQQGRRGEFWVPTYAQDFTVQQNATAADNKLIVDADQSDLLTLDPSLRALCLRTSTGATLYRKIVSWSSLLGATELVLSEPWPTGILAAQIERASWMHLSRFASDDMTISWITDGAAQLAWTVESLEAEPPDVF